MIFELVAAYYWLILVKNNLFLFHILVPIQYAFLVTPYYFSVLLKKFKTYIFLSILTVFLSAILFSLTIQPLSVYNTYTQLLVYILLLTWAALFILKLLNDKAMLSIEREPLFWISLGIIVYSTTNFVITGTLNYLIVHDIDWAKILYNVTTLVAFIMYIIFTFSFFSPKVFKISSFSV